jgi:hypothetical protein
MGLQERLDEAGISYATDDGSGFVLSEAGARIWVTGNLEQEPLLESAYRGMSSIWSAAGTTVFAEPSLTSVSYFYWRAGGVDHSMECDVALSDIPSSLRESVEDLIRAANNKPYDQG